MFLVFDQELHVLIGPFVDSDIANAYVKNERLERLSKVKKIMEDDIIHEKDYVKKRELYRNLKRLEETGLEAFFVSSMGEYMPQSYTKNSNYYTVLKFEDDKLNSIPLTINPDPKI